NQPLDVRMNRVREVISNDLKNHLRNHAMDLSLGLELLSKNHTIVMSPELSPKVYLKDREMDFSPALVTKVIHAVKTVKLTNPELTNKIIGVLEQLFTDKHIGRAEMGGRQFRVALYEMAIPQERALFL